MLTAEDKKLIQQAWEKAASHQEEFGAEALTRCEPGPGAPGGVGIGELEPRGAGQVLECLGVWVGAGGTAGQQS